MLTFAVVVALTCAGALLARGCAGGETTPEGPADGVEAHLSARMEADAAADALEHFYDRLVSGRTEGLDALAAGQARKALDSFAARTRSDHVAEFRTTAIAREGALFEFTGYERLGAHGDPRWRRVTVAMSMRVLQSSARGVNVEFTVIRLGRDRKTVARLP